MMPARPRLGRTLAVAVMLIPVLSGTARGDYVVIPAPAEGPRLAPVPQHRIVYLNAHGGTYTQGPNDSSKNTSSLAVGSATISAWNKGEAGWAQVVTCARDAFARFDIEVTETDPGETAHVEVVVGGWPDELGLPEYVLGIATMHSDCSVVERGVVYAFAEAHYDDLQSLCETVAHEAGHSFGLDHEYLCEDPMTYLYGCGAKTFQDLDAECGEDWPRPCVCGDATQNSVRILFDVAGPHVDDVGDADAGPGAGADSPVIRGTCAAAPGAPGAGAGWLIIFSALVLLRRSPRARG